MTKERVQEYSVRISQANRTEMVVIIFELILEHIEYAGESLGKGNRDGYEKNLKKAQSFLNELMGALDYQFELSYQLMSLYIYVNKVLSNAVLNQVGNNLDSAISVIGKLLSAYREVAEQDDSEALMNNSQQIYAGLTYGKGMLNETCISSDEGNRGFRA